MSQLWGMLKNLALLEIVKLLAKFLPSLAESAACLFCMRRLWWQMKELTSGARVKMSYGLSAE
jgi:hypothetical protein